MPTVPVTPSVQMTTTAPGSVQAGQAVQPMRDFSADQMANSGRALQQAGSTLSDIAVNLQDRFNDARTKELYTSYSREVDKIQTQFSATQGVDAAHGAIYDQNVAKLNELREEYAAAAENPLIARTFNERSDVLISSAAQSMAKHSLAETKRYEASESAAEIQVNMNRAARHWTEMNNPDSDYHVYMAASIQQASNLAISQGIPEGSYQYKQSILEVTDGIHANVISNMMAAEDYVQAKEYLQQKYNDGELRPQTFQRMQNAVDAGADRQTGIEAANSVFINSASSALATPNTFDSALPEILLIEGGYVADDAGRGPTNFGINGRANGLSDDEVRNLTRAQAANIYKERYWDAIGADNLPTEIQMLAFDAAVNQGTPTARAMLREAQREDGTYDVAAFVAARRERYQATLQSGRYAAMSEDERSQYAASWESRIRRVSNGRSVQINAENNLPNLADMQAIIRERVTDPGAQEIALTQLNQNYREADAAQKQQYQNMVRTATDIAAQSEGNWRTIPADIMSQLKPEDRQAIIQFDTRPTQYETELLLTQDPRLTVPGVIENYRHQLSQQDYLRLSASGIEYARKAGTPNQRVASIPTGLVESSLARYSTVRAGEAGVPTGSDITGLARLLSPKTEDDRLDRIKLESDFRIEAQRMLDQINQGSQNPRDLYPAESEQIMNRLLTDYVMVDDYGGDTVTRFFETGNMTADEKENVYIQYGNEQIPLSNIDPDTTTEISTAYQRRFGRPITQAQLVQDWVALGRPRSQTVRVNGVDTTTIVPTVTETPDAPAEAVQPRPTQGGHSGRAARARWDREFGETHNVDGTLKTQGQ
jgi:lysozyme family protein